MKMPSIDLLKLSPAIFGMRTLLLVLVTTSMLLPDSARAQNDRLYETAVDAYVYAYPMVLTEITRRFLTNVEAPDQNNAPMNQLTHVRRFPGPADREVVRPNADTLYSIAWWDVSGEPMVASLPDTGDRYYMFPLLDFWTDVIAAPGTRTSGNQAGDFAIVGPDWQGELPDGIDLIRSPTNQGWIIGRTQVNGAADLENVHRVQDGMKFVPLSSWGRPYTPPAGTINPDWDMQTLPPFQVAAMDAGTYFALFAELLKLNPPHEMDWNIVTQLRQIGIVPGQDFDFSGLPAETRAALERAVPTAQHLIANHGASSGEMVEGWSIALSGMGNYGTSYMQRAYIALIGLGANVPEDAVYPMTAVDANGIPYHGRNKYVVHFDDDELPPVNGFWSLTLYDGEGYMVKNPINRNAIGDRDELRYNDDGSLDIYIQHESPGADKESNWLPTPADEFNIVLRLYWPRSEILTGEWTPPPLLSVSRGGTGLPQ